MPRAKFAAVSFQAKSANRKFSLLTYEPDAKGQLRPTPQPPYVSSTYVSIRGTCPEACVFRDSGCFVQSGFTQSLMNRLDDQAKTMTPSEVIDQEVRALDAAWSRDPMPRDGAKGGRDLRLHVGGDTPNAESARKLGAACGRYKNRGGGSVWSYTHNWRTIHRDDFGEHIFVLASVEATEEITEARSRGYVAAITVREFPGTTVFDVGGHKVLPCPAETRGATCAECRLCLDRETRLRDLGYTIGFSVHGAGSNQAKRRLPVLGTEKQLSLKDQEGESANVTSR